MSALDAAFFFIENENAPMHVGSVTVFDGQPPSYGDVVRLFVAKLADVPRYRQRVRSMPLHLGRPVWVEDDHFQILYHVRHTAVPAPGGDDQLRNLAGRVFAQRLDLAKPLWEVWLVEGLADDRWALISKVHHCMIDGVAGNDLLHMLLDRDPTGEPPEPTTWTPPANPSAVELVADGLRDAVTAPLRQLAAIPDLARRLRNPEPLIEAGRALASSLPATARRLVTRPARSLNGPIGPHRRWVWAHADLAEIKRVRAALGGTVNDVILAAVTRGFRDLLSERDELVEGRDVRSLVPVSVRGSTERGTLNNRVSAVLVNFPVGERDPLLRFAAVRAQMDDLKSSRQAVGADLLTNLGNFAAPTLLALGTRAAMNIPQQLFQTVTTNVPGPRVPLYLLGRRLARLYPYVPITSNLRISIGIFSYLDQISFGINADFDSVPDVQVLADGIRAGFDELVERAEAVAARPS